MRFQNLPDVHTRRNAKRIQNDLDGSAIRKVRHVFLRHDARNDALVAVAAGHLVADGEFALHGDVDLDQFDHARRQLVALLELLLALFGDLAQHVDLPRGHLLDLFDLLDEQRIFFVELQALEVARGDCLEDVAGLHDSADSNDAAPIQVAEERLANIGNVASDFLGTELGVAGLDFVLLDVNRGVVVVLDQLFADQDGVFEVIAAPREERHQDVAPERQLAAIGARAVRENLGLLHAIAYAHQRLLAHAGVLVRTLEFDELIDVCAHFAAEHAGVIGLHAHDDALGVNLVDDAFPLAQHDGAGVARGNALHAGPH